MVYYRLEQVDLDGKSSYSKVLLINLKNDKRQFIVSPNPFSSYLNINMDWDKNEKIVGRVINSQGSTVISKNIQLTAGINNFSIEGLSKLPSGNYYIQFMSGTGTITQKIIKQ